MTQSRAVLPTVQPPFSGDNARPLPSQQPYLGENIANQITAMRLEPPPAYHGKQLAEGEMVIPTDSQPPPPEAETPPAYMTPTMALLPPAYMPNINARQATEVP
ncbi:uncharacterized protein B0H18DRAFT_1118660 [Fomitopsis serialis]|uniref:uncharacterized protein n=1 Tax=Fomitopsis serialis TaxID=139415 RepID=UPI0020077416|nr:uncharacterized protein B0H18DRAFT_1118660 [Neoantrodia serialis]KAH9926899.1 hypothetical protein B0H18DRAFT_1118660 [Neoantrodia serialis]